MGGLEQTLQIMSGPLYSLLYQNTVKVAPDAWLIPGIVIGVLQFTAYILARRLKQSEKTTTEMVDVKSLKNKGAVDHDADESNAMISKLDKTNYCKENGN